MVDERKVVQNPLLRLKTKPITEGITGRSKDPSKIKQRIYQQRRSHLLGRLDYLRNAPETVQATHAGKVLMWVGLDEDSQATTHTPDDLFGDGSGTELVAAWRNGYIVQFSPRAYTKLRERIADPDNDQQRCDIYRSDALELFASMLNEPKRIASSWQQATPDNSGRRLFETRLPAFLDQRALASVVKTMAELVSSGRIALPASAVRTALLGYDGTAEESPTWLPSARFEEEVNAIAHAGSSIPLGISDQSAIAQLITSGAIVRWEPVGSIRPTNPGAGPEPTVTLPSMDHEPIVGVIDGGYHATRYRGAVAWRLTPALIPDGMAARAHGNKVASVVVDAHSWSNQLVLPAIHCRLGVVQAIADPSSSAVVTTNQLANHLERAFHDHPETHVWNLSANIDRDCDDFEVSELGDRLNQLARQYNKLLVISAGNRTTSSRVAPPADCESAIVVGGRSHDGRGMPAGPCPTSRRGFGPEGMLKPETSWFSEHRVLGGAISRGTSFAAPLVSRVAAHTWENLAEPNPDIVKALVISAADLDEYSPDLGFGSPTRPLLPWTCSPNTAVVAWSEEVTALKWYYWTGIRVPPSLIQAGRFVGRAKLVAVLQPVTQANGHQYLSTRLQTGLQYKKPAPKGKTKNGQLVGCLNPQERELTARVVDHKWDPVRVYSQEFKPTNGPKLMGPQPTLQVYARVFWRNQFLYSAEFMREHPHRVNFVVTLEAPDPNADTYNEFRRIMAENVETALAVQEVEVESDEDIE